MSPAKRDDSRPARRWSKLKPLPALQQGRGRWIVRWIGAAKRRASKLVEVEPAPSAQIIQLSWADTFGRPLRIAPARLLQLVGVMIPLLPL